MAGGGAAEIVARAVCREPIGFPRPPPLPVVCLFCLYIAVVDNASVWNQSLQQGAGGVA